MSSACRPAHWSTKSLQGANYTTRGAGQLSRTGHQSNPQWRVLIRSGALQYLERMQCISAASAQGTWRSDSNINMSYHVSVLQAPGRSNPAFEGADRHQHSPSHRSTPTSPTHGDHSQALSCMALQMQYKIVQEIIWGRRPTDAALACRSFRPVSAPRSASLHKKTCQMRRPRLADVPTKCSLVQQGCIEA